MQVKEKIRLNKLKTVTIITALLFLIYTPTQAQYWQQEVNHTINVKLNDTLHSLQGFSNIEYFNHSPDTLRYIWFHIWPNAYKNDKTAFSEQLLTNGNTSFYFSSKEEKGYINQLDFKVNDITASFEDHPQHIDIIKLLLPSPLLPHQKINITTPFHVKLPHHFSRSGHIQQSYQIAQWYPKPAVYDKDGWHPMPYLDQGEFYSEFGRYSVNITLPQNYVVAATGQLKTTEEKEWLIQQRNKTTFSNDTKSNTIPQSSSSLKTLRYEIENAHDFAWFADKRFIVEHDTLYSLSGKQIDIFSYHLPSSEKKWKKSTDYLKNSIRFFSNEVGEYPYNTVSAVDGPPGTGGGMEYPTITLISPVSSGKELERIIFHEVGHNWFYGILASNERLHPWMDEGITSFYDKKYFSSSYDMEDGLIQAVLESKVQANRSQAIDIPSADYSELNYGLIAYHKAAKWVAYLEENVGKNIFQKAMHKYFQQWKFKHPQPKNLKQIFEEEANKKLDEVFSLLNKKDNMPNLQKSGTKWTASFNAITGKYNNKKNIITTLPSVGFNTYDGLMGGVMITNLKLPPNRFRFLVAPQYGFRSNKITGSGFMSYSIYPAQTFHRIDIGINAAAFSINDYVDNEKNKTFAGQVKIAPSVKFTWKENNPKSTFHKYIRLKGFFFNEERLAYSVDSLITSIDTSIIVKANPIAASRNLFQLKGVIENNRALYPYKGDLTIEKGKEFIRAAFTGNYFFNYAHKGGLNVRLFAGKFFYTKNNQNNFSTQRYHLNMTGANGYEDYTYNDYFIGRNEFEGLPSQQIMERDGGFKIRTDLLNQKVGRTDNWLIAANFSSTLPNAINPFKALPFHIPIKLFADIGTYAEAWQPNSNLDRFIFDAGIQLSLFKETINIYLPLVYSKVYKDYIQSTIPKKERLLKKISFSIDLANFGMRKIDRQLVLF